MVVPNDFDWDEEEGMIFLSARHRFAILFMIKREFELKPGMNEERKKSLLRLREIISESLESDGVFEKKEE